MRLLAWKERKNLQVSSSQTSRRGWGWEGNSEVQSGGWFGLSKRGKTSILRRRHSGCWNKGGERGKEGLFDEGKSEFQWVRVGKISGEQKQRNRNRKRIGFNISV